MVTTVRHRGDNSTLLAVVPLWIQYDIKLLVENLDIQIVTQLCRNGYNVTLKGAVGLGQHACAGLWIGFEFLDDFFGGLIPGYNDRLLWFGDPLEGFGGGLVLEVKGFLDAIASIKTLHHPLFVPFLAGFTLLLPIVQTKIVLHGLWGEYLVGIGGKGHDLLAMVGRLLQGSLVGKAWLFGVE